MITNPRAAPKSWIKATMAPLLLQRETGLALGSLAVPTKPEDCATGYSSKAFFKSAMAPFKAFIAFYYD